MYDYSHQAVREAREVEKRIETAPKSLWSLPSPKRYALTEMWKINRLVLTAELYEPIVLLMQKGMASCDLINELCRYDASRKIINQLCGHSAANKYSQNLGAMDTILAPTRYAQCGGRMFTVRDSLNEQLLHTDIGSKAPCLFFKPPYNNCYIEFGQQRMSIPYGDFPEERPALWNYNQASGIHQVEGVYISTTEVSHLRDRSPSFTDKLGIDRSKPATMFELVFAGSPVGKKNILDDATSSITLFLQDDTQTVEEMLERHCAHYSTVFDDKEAALSEPNARVYGEAGIKRQNMTADSQASYKALITHLAKVLLYINSEESILTPDNAADRALESLSKVGKAKLKKRQRQAERVYNTIYVGSRESVVEKTEAYHHHHHTTASSSSSPGKHVKAHWRRGHYRNQRYGEGRGKLKLMWIKPVLVRKGDIEAGTGKEYVIR